MIDVEIVCSQNNVIIFKTKINIFHASTGVLLSLDILVSTKLAAAMLCFSRRQTQLFD
jgi:hypothetical protein